MTNFIGKLVWVTTMLLAASGCVSHRYVVNDPIPTLNRWDKLDRTSPGTEINIRLQTGMIISGSFQGSTADQLRVSTDVGNEMNIAKADVVEIMAADADDLYNGAAWGLGIGALGALGGGASQGAGAGGAAFVQVLGLALLLDWLHQEHEVIYIAP